MCLHIYEDSFSVDGDQVPWGRGRAFCTKAAYGLDQFRFHPPAAFRFMTARGCGPVLLSLCLTPEEGLCSSRLWCAPPPSDSTPGSRATSASRFQGPHHSSQSCQPCRCGRFSQSLCVFPPRPSQARSPPWAFTGTPTHHTHTQPLLQHLGELSLVSFFPLPLLPLFSKDLLLPTLPGSISGLGRFPGGGHGNPLQESCLEKPHGQRSLAGCSPRGCKELALTG